MSRRNLIVSFTHTNYNVKTGGTEKYIKELSEVLKKDGYFHLCFFPFPKRKSFTGKDIVGVNFNDKFVGIVKSSSIAETIQYYLKKYDLLLNCFHIQHLIRHNIADVFAAILAFEATVYIFAHDFYLVCKSEHLIDSDGRFCGDSNPSEEKCVNCAYCSEALNHYNTIRNFIEGTKDRIGHIICPSNYVRNVFAAAFPFVSDRMIVRPHLVLSGERNVGGDTDDIRIAFLGRKRDQKGYDKWLEMLKALSGSGILGAYHFCYLGMDVEEDRDVENVYVSITTQGNDAMKNAVAQHGVNCAFLWSRCPETYSYVYYELLMSGVYIITNSESGNICDEVRNRGNGVVFDRLEECIQWLRKPEEVKKAITAYREQCAVPVNYEANRDIGTIVADKPCTRAVDGTARKGTMPVSSLLYRIKYRKYKL